jgi:hypothetical protein
MLKDFLRILLYNFFKVGKNLGFRTSKKFLAPFCFKDKLPIFTNKSLKSKNFLKIFKIKFFIHEIDFKRKFETTELDKCQSSVSAGAT